MADTIIADLCQGRILQSKLFATVTPECVVVRDLTRQSHTIIALSELSGMRRVRTTYPVLLVISCGLFLISAAAFSSKEGSGAGIPTGLLGAAFTSGYFLARRACVSFIVGPNTVETANGSLSEAAALIYAVRSAQAQLSE